MTHGVAEFKIDRIQLEMVCDLLRIERAVKVYRRLLPVAVDGLWSPPTESRPSHRISLNREAPAHAANESLMHELIHARQWEEAWPAARGSTARWGILVADHELPYKDQWSEAEANALAPVLASRVSVALPMPRLNLSSDAPA